MAYIIDSYSESNHDGNTFDFTSTTRACGQSFYNGTINVLHSVSLFLNRRGSASGNCRVRIFAHSGTYGTSSIPTGTVLATSNNVSLDAVPLFPEPYALVEFLFSGSEKIDLVENTHYTWVMDYPDSDGTTTNRLSLAQDRTIVSHQGNLFSSLNGSSFSPLSTTDCIFYVYGDLTTTTSPFPSFRRQ